MGGRGSVLQVVDAERGVELARIRLRSKAFDIDEDASTQTFVTSQSGGLDKDVDNAVGVIDVRHSLTPRYITLPVYDPLDIAALNGRAYTVHGVCGPTGLAMCAVDIRHGSLIATGWAPDGSGQMDAAGRRVFIPHWDAEGGRSASDDSPKVTALGAVGPSLDTTHVLEHTFVAGGFVASDPTDPSGRRVLLAGTVESETAPGTAEIWRVDAVGHGLISRVSLGAMNAGAYQLAASRDVVAVIDGTGFDPVAGGASVRLIDPHTLREIRRLPLADGPCDIAALGDLVFVAEKGADRVVGYGVDGRQRFRVRLADPRAVMVRLAVLGRR
jgi:hypothetical protein